MLEETSQDLSTVVPRDGRKQTGQASRRQERRVGLCSKPGWLPRVGGSTLRTSGGSRATGGAGRSWRVLERGPLGLCTKKVVMGGQ